MSEYWIGKDIDYDKLWSEYEGGKGYIEKFNQRRFHLLRIELKEQPKHLPLFNFEAVFKTIKGYYHDLKQCCLSHEEYNSSSPLFIHSVNRGSGIWDFLGELRQLIMLGTTLADQKTIGQALENIDKKMEFIKKNFDDNAISEEDFQKFMKAKSSFSLTGAVQKLCEQGIVRIQISKEPFKGDFKRTEASLVTLFPRSGKNVYGWWSVHEYLSSAPRVFEEKGLLVGIVYFLYHCFRAVSLRRVYFERSERHGQYDREKNKAKPRWQDGYVLLTFIVSYLLLLLFKNKELLTNCCWTGVFVLIACYFLVEILAYFVEALWLYDLPEPGFLGKASGTWSFKRIGFQAFLDYFQSIAVFSFVYSLIAQRDTLLTWYKFSFITATTFSIPDALKNTSPWLQAVWGAQIIFSLFIVVTVLAAFTSEVYQRKEVN